MFGGMGKSIPTSTVQRYDPVSNSWSHGSPLRSRRWGMGVAPLSNYIYIVGGVNEKNESLCSVERYNIMEDHWTNEIPMSSRRSGLGVTVAKGMNLCTIFVRAEKNILNFYFFWLLQL